MDTTCVEAISIDDDAAVAIGDDVVSSKVYVDTTCVEVTSTGTVIVKVSTDTEELGTAVVVTSIDGDAVSTGIDESITDVLVASGVMLVVETVTELGTEVVGISETEPVEVIIEEVVIDESGTTEITASHLIQTVSGKSWIRTMLLFSVFLYSIYLLQKIFTG